MKTIVLGASTNPGRYSFTAVKRLLEHGIEVIPIGIREGEINGQKIVIGMPQIENVHTVTLYLNPEKQKAYYDYVVKLAPRRIIFNPGTENPEFYKIARENNIKTETACTLVMLSVGTFRDP